MKEENTYGGIGIPMVLFLIFLVMKLTNTIDWSWWWIFSPLLISAGLATIALIVMIIIFSRK